MTISRTNTELFPEGDDSQDGCDLASWEDFFAAYDQEIRKVVSWSKWHFDQHTQQDVQQKIRTEVSKSDIRACSPKDIRIRLKRISVCRCIDEIRKLVRYHERIVLLDGTGELSKLASDSQANEQFDPVKEVYAHEQAVVVQDLIGLSTVRRRIRSTVRRRIRSTFRRLRSVKIINVVSQI